MSEFRILALMGPSAAGKTTLGGLAKLPELVSHTTRPPRPKEVDGTDYYFVQPADIYELEAAGQLVEMNTYAGQIYALSAPEIEAKLAQNDTVFVVLERHGVEQLLQHPVYGPMTRVVFVNANKYDLATRMRARGQVQIDIDQRLARYDEELQGICIAHAGIYNEELSNSLRFLQKLINRWKGGR